MQADFLQYFYPSTDLPIHRSTDPLIYRSIDLLFHRFTDPLIYRSIDLLFHRSTDLSIYWSIDLPIHRSTVPSIYCSIDLLFHRSTVPSIYRSIDLPIHWSTDPSIYYSIDLQFHRSTDHFCHFLARGYNDFLRIPSVDQKVEHLYLELLPDSLLLPEGQGPRGQIRNHAYYKHQTPQESFGHCSGSRTKTGLVLEVFKSKGCVDMPNLSVFYGVQLLKRVA